MSSPGIPSFAHLGLRVNYLAVFPRLTGLLTSINMDLPIPLAITATKLIIPNGKHLTNTASVQEGSL